MVWHAFPRCAFVGADEETNTYRARACRLLWPRSTREHPAGAQLIHHPQLYKYERANSVAPGLGTCIHPDTLSQVAPDAAIPIVSPRSPIILCRDYALTSRHVNRCPGTRRYTHANLVGARVISAPRRGTSPLFFPTFSRMNK